GLALLSAGAGGVQSDLAAARAEARSAAKRSALADAVGYFERRAELLGYAERLAAGQSIGSGLVEGACKQVIGRRMKQTGARWRIRRGGGKGGVWWWCSVGRSVPSSAARPDRRPA